jgi:hypothetical protein
MTYEYLKMLTVLRSERRTLNLYPLIVMSIWNCISMIMHLVFGLQLFLNFKKLIWLIVSSLTVAHFSI